MEPEVSMQTGTLSGIDKTLMYMSRAMVKNRLKTIALYPCINNTVLYTCTNRYYAKIVSLPCFVVNESLSEKAYLQVFDHPAEEPQRQQEF